MKNQDSVSIQVQCQTLAMSIVRELCHFEDAIDEIRAVNKVAEQITDIAKDAYVKGGNAVHDVLKHAQK